MAQPQTERDLLKVGQGKALPLHLALADHAPRGKQEDIMGATSDFRNSK